MRDKKSRRERLPSTSSKRRKSPAKRYPLTEFLISLTEPEQQGRFLKNPDGMMRAAGLSATQRTAVKSGKSGWIRLLGRKAQQYAVGKPRVRCVSLAKLPEAKLTGISTLYIPPKERPEPDPEMMERLGLKMFVASTG